MADESKVVTGLGLAELHRVLVRGRDLTEDMLGNITFTEMVLFELSGRIPTANQSRMIDALLVILVEHGMVASVVASRSTYHTAPEAIQGAVAAALLTAGSVHLGSSEYCAKMLADAFPVDTKEGDSDKIAGEIVDRYAAAKTRVAGIGHRTHAEGDPRAVKLFQIARETEVFGRYCDLLLRVSTLAGDRAGRPLPVNVTGAIGAIALDLGLPWQMAKAFALIGRTLGALAHIGEEIRNPMAQKIDAAIKARLVYEVEEPQ